MLLPFAGFFLSTIVYSFALMYLGHYRRLSHVALLSVAIAFAFMFLFMRVVYVALPAGVAPFDSIVLRADGGDGRALGGTAWSSSISPTAFCRCSSRSTC